MKNLRALNSFKQVNGKNVEDPKNFPGTRVISVEWRSQGSEGIIGMLGEANQALSPLAYLIDDEKFASHVVWKVSISLYPSLDRALKIIFP